MQKYKLIVADTTNPTYSKMSAMVAQAIAAGYGYPHTTMSPTDREVLVFNPNSKSVGLFNRKGFVENYNASPTIFTADGLVCALQNPELDAITIEAGDGCNNATVWDGAITFRSKTSRLVGTVTVPKAFIRKVLDMDKPTSELPVVAFDYPDSSNFSFPVRRRVKVTKMDGEYIWGFEIFRDGPVGTPTFKKYAISKTGNVTLLEYMP